MKRITPRGRLLLLSAIAIAFTLPATATGNPILGWLGIAAFAGALVAYVAWRREVRRGRVFDR